MKAVFITYDQAYNEEIVDILTRNGQRGFTRWTDVHGTGGIDGEPRLGSHAWPALNHAILTVVPDDKVDAILKDLKAKDEEAIALGLRAFVWNIETNY